MGPYQILAIAVATPPSLWALVKLGGWVRGKSNTQSEEKGVDWNDFVEDIKSLEGASDVNGHKEDYRISLEYDRSSTQFHKQTKYDYEILDFKKPLLMVEPLQ